MPFQTPFVSAKFVILGDRGALSQSINQSTGLFVWQLKSWIETCIRLELPRNCTITWGGSL